VTARILFVDDEPRVLDGLKRMLHGQRQEWSMDFAPGAPAALELLGQREYDVILTDMRMPGMDGAALLTEVAARYPATIRVVLSGQTDDAAALRAMPVAHQFLMKPCDVETLRTVISRTTRLRGLLGDPVLREVAGEIDSLPPVPGTYLALGRLLGASSTSISDIADTVSRDPALTAKLLQVVNSSFFGQRREISSVSHACTLLGTGLIRSIVLARELYTDGLWRRCPAALIESECDHAVAVAGLARAMQVDAAQAEAAVAAGLLHDVGKLIMATRDPRFAMTEREESLRSRRPVAELEMARLGVSHAEVGAYLLGLWGLPHGVVEAVAYHHSPNHGATPPSRVAAAVHVADALVHQARGDLDVPIDDGCIDLIGGPAELERLAPLAAGAAA
jgi:putative nucleotidyltransferase with HDIG domain